MEVLYAKFDNHAEQSSLSAKLMPFTGLAILVYIIFHLLDFTFAEKVGVINGQDLGLYGLVVTSFMNPLHSAIYIVAMLMLGLHLVHSIQSIFQTFGIAKQSNLHVFRRVSLLIGMGVAFAYSSIPLYVLLKF